MTGDVVLAQLELVPPVELPVERRWLIDEVGRWVAGGAKVMLVTGPPGSGKTTLSARLTRDAREERPGCLFPVHAAHFCGRTKTPPSALAVLESVANQLARTLPGYFFDVTTTKISVSANTVADGGSLIGVGTAYFSVGRSPIVDSLEDLIRTPFQRLRDAGKLPSGGVFVVIDGIDGITRGDGSSQLLEPLAGMLADIEGLRLFITQRPSDDSDVRRLRHVQPLDLDQAHAAEDVGQYLSGRLAGQPYLNQIVRLSGTNLLVARLLADNTELLRTAALETMEGALGVLDEFYEVLLRQQAAAFSRDRQRTAIRAVLSVIAQGRDASGMPLNLLKSTVGSYLGGLVESPLEIDQYISACRGLVEMVDAGAYQAIRLFHPSFRDYLLGSAVDDDGRSIDPAQVNRAISAQLVRRWHLVAADRAPADSASAGTTDYLYEHLLAHLADSADDTADLPPFEHKISLIFEIAGRHGLPHLVAQLDHLAQRADADDVDLEVLNGMVGVQARNLLDWPEHDLPGRFFGQLLLEARIVGNTRLADELREEAGARYVTQLSTAWASGSHEHLRPAHLLDHRSAVITAVIPLPDDTVATADQAGHVRVWELLTGRLLRSWPGDQPVRALAVTSPQLLLVAGGDDGAGRVWNPRRTGEALRHRRFGHPIRMLTPVPGEHDRVLVVTDRSSLLWDAETDQVVPLEDLHGDQRIVATAAAPGLIVVATTGGRIGLFDAVSGARTRVFDNDGGIRCLALHDSGRYLGVGGADGTTTVWDLHRPDARPHRLGTGRAPISAITATTGVRQVPVLLDGDHDGTASAWHMVDGKQIWHRPDSGRMVTTFAARAGTGFVVVGNRGQIAEIRSARTGALRHRLACGGAVTGAVVNNSGQYLVTATNSGAAQVWRVPSVADVPAVAGHDRRVTMAARTDAGFVTVGGRDLLVWDPADGHIVRQHTFASDVTAIVPAAGKTIVCLSGGTAFTWDGASGAPPGQRDDLPAGCTAVGANASGTTVFAMADGTIRVHPSGGATVDRIQVGSPILKIVLTPDGGTAVTTHRDRSVELWDLRTGASVARISNFFTTVTGVALVPGTGSVALACLDGTITVVELATGAVVRQINRTRRDTLLTLSVLGDGAFLAAGYEDGGSCVWRAGDGDDPIVTLGHPGAVNVIDALGRRHFLTGAADGSVALWELPESGGEVRQMAHVTLESGVACVAGSADPAQPILVGTDSGSVVCMSLA